MFLLCRYNDCMSLGINLFGTHWSWPHGEEPGAVAHNMGGVYPFGVDPEWHNTTTELSFYNSLKMKLSVIIGIIQMSFGLILGLTNHIHYGNYLNIWCEFIPQMIFMMSLFGYLIVMIITKWSIDWSAVNVNGLNPDGTPCLLDPPNLITTLINMMLNPGVVECKSVLFQGQAELQASLVSFALISVPWILIPKPAILYFLHQQSQSTAVVHHAAEGDDEAPPAPAEEEEAGGDGGHGHDGPFDIGEVCIHQMIHTIEFVLGTVSNTASYLRLWALSLAHAELAKVFFDKILYASWMTGSGTSIVIGTAMFMSATFSVLMCMDVLECFLHALRLHWVEFQVIPPLLVCTSPLLFVAV
jgi:V-type H+-transporting ATPase subunit a